MLYADFRGLKISKLGLGTWAIGAGKDWGPADKNDSVRAIHAALDGGINLIDTAPIYGNFHAEIITGEALKGRRDKALLCTKCGLLPGERAVKFDLSPKAVRAEAEESLKRLQTDYIDVYLIHWPDKNTPLADTLGEFEKLKAEGKIRFYGACNLSTSQLEAAKALSDISFAQNEYSILNKSTAPEVIDFCAANNIAFTAYGVLGGGILSGKYIKEPCLPRCSVKSFFYKFYKGEAFEESGKIVQALADIAAHHNAKPAEAALNFTLANSGVTCALFGARNSHQVQENIAAANWQFTQQDLDYLNDRYA